VTDGTQYLLIGSQQMSLLKELQKKNNETEWY